MLLGTNQVFLKLFLIFFETFGFEMKLYLINDFNN